MSTQPTGSQLSAFVLVLLGVVLFLPALSVAIGLLGYGMLSGGGGHMMDGGTMTSGAFLLAVLFRLLVLAGLVAGGYLLYRAVTGREDAALAELRRAYARGDLSDEEFERRKERLEREE